MSEYERHDAQRLQTRIVPRRHVVAQGVELFGDSIPAGSGRRRLLWRVAADADTLHFCVADVSGKGTPGALIAAMLYASVSTLSSSSNSPESVLVAGRDHAAQPVGRRTLRHHLLRRSRSADAGAAFRECRPLSANFAARRWRGRIAGADAAGAWASCWTTASAPSACRLTGGDRLLLYTDGVSEATNDAEEEFGPERLAELVDGPDERDHGAALRGRSWTKSASCGRQVPGRCDDAAARGERGGLPPRIPSTRTDAQQRVSVTTRLFGQPSRRLPTAKQLRLRSSFRADFSRAVTALFSVFREADLADAPSIECFKSPVIEPVRLQSGSAARRALTTGRSRLETRYLRKESFDVIVLGAGAAGLMCAIEAGKRGRRVAVLEHAERIGKKILISGGGRCNFTNLHCRPENFLSANPHFCQVGAGALHSCGLHRAGREAWHRLSRENAGTAVLRSLRAGHRRHAGGGVPRCGVRIFAEYASRARFEPTTRISCVRTGDDEFQRRRAGRRDRRPLDPEDRRDIVRLRLGAAVRLKIARMPPALVPLTFERRRSRRLLRPGRSLGGGDRLDWQQHFREKMLITHRGLSGPAILQISSYWEKPAADYASIWRPAAKSPPALRRQRTPRLAAAKAALPRVLCRIRLADRWLELHPPQRWTNRRRSTDWSGSCIAGRSLPGGTEGYEKAEVTAGGVDTDELSAKTMESRKVPGLFFIGEVVDVTGHLGGFNFQWAWASGFSAGQAV